MRNFQTICMIPARMASSRFPGKPLAPMLGHPMLMHVYDRCVASTSLDRTVIATCDDEIRELGDRVDAEIVMTADTHPGCVDRCCEALEKIAPDAPDDTFIVMVQGDEVMVTPEMIDGLITSYDNSRAPVVNVASRIRDLSEHDNPNCVKVSMDISGKALFFSRSPIPSRTRTNDVPMYQQTGIIGFSKKFLLSFGSLERTPLEMAEGVDMLRTLEHGFEIMIETTEAETIGVDTEDDLKIAEGLLAQDPLTTTYLP
jgi:3-deoxy-manno-octulosonate cytidylyltransferase (CMP-KDO synthetase)